VVVDQGPNWTTSEQAQGAQRARIAVMSQHIRGFKV
jgi:hypothetical protein